MIKIIFLFFSISILLANNIKIFGEKSVSVGDIITIYDGMLLKDGMTVSAHKIIYNKLTKKAIAVGSVYINYDKSNYILSNKVKINLNNNNINAKPFFLFNFDGDSWINSEKMDMKNDTYFGKYSIASTCSVNTPDWKLVATSTDYNKKTKWLDLYNPVLYLKGVPIFYLPYLGFSLDKTRSSGFLRPLVGYSGNEGFFFTLPYYQVLGNAADLEIDPTIRTVRGKGIYTTFRFVHSATSYGEFKTGIFTDKETYNKEYNLANLKHRGWSFLYTNHSIINDSDQLYMDLKSANDPDYFYLDAHNYTFVNNTDKVLTSKMNYVTQKNYNFLGIYGTYFKDTSKLSNADTMQILPQINYHRFNDNFWNNFSYSLDANIYNYTRKQGYTVVKQSAVIPLNYNVNFFDDYVKVGLTHELSINRVTTDDGNVSKYLSGDTIVKLYTNLSKNYGSFAHHMVPSVSYGVNNYTSFNGVENDYLQKTALQKNLSFSLQQYLISADWTLNHRVSQTYYLENNSTKYSDIRNDISFKYLNFYTSDSTVYAPSTNDITYNVFTIGYDNNVYKLENRYLYKKDVGSEDRTRTDHISAYWKFDGIHKIFGEYDYDMENKYMKYEVFGISMNKRCWTYSISYKKEITPSLTNDGISNIIQRTIYFQIQLIPLGGFQQQYKFKPQGGTQ